MLKLYFTSLIIILGSIQLVSTNCPDRLLYCFNDKEELLGAIQVNQCWSWSRISVNHVAPQLIKKRYPMKNTFINVAIIIQHLLWF
jgi:hypothetical protein